MAPPALLQQLLLLLSLAATARQDSTSTSTSTTVVHSNTEPLLGTDGKQIDAHETQIVRWDPSGPWYMYAMKCTCPLACMPCPAEPRTPPLCASD